MTEIGQRIRDARERIGMTQQALGARCGVSRAAVAQWESGTTRPSLHHLQCAAEALGVWVSWMTGEGDGADTEGMSPARPAAPAGRNARPVPTPPIPVVDYVRAGNWDTVTDAWPPGRGMEMLVTEQRVSANGFGLIVRGDSMSPEFREDDKIIIDPDIAPQPGDFVVAKLDGEEEATFKKYRPRGTDDRGRPVVDLVPLNEDWPTLRIDAAHPGRIIGTVVEHRRYRRRSGAGR